MDRISDSVGHGGMNLQSDVATVQTLLNRHRIFTQPLLMVDRVAGGLTIVAIQEFQTRVVKMPKPDGRVDPHGATAEFLYTSPNWLPFQDTAKYLNGLATSVESQFKKAAAGACSILPNNIFSQCGQIAWGAKVSPEFKAKVIKICENLDIEPDHLMTCMAFETGETFSPKEKNKAGSSGTGLIQFMEATAKSVLGTSTKALAAMSDIQQLDYVEKYFKYIQRSHKQLNTLESVYFAILDSSGIGKNDDAVMFKGGTKAYEGNKGLDKNKDNKITVGEVATKIRQMYQKGLQQGYLG